MATTHGPSENNYLAGTPGNDQIYGYESNDNIKTDDRAQAVSTEKVLILQSLVCNSTAAGGDNPDQILLIVQGNGENSLNFPMSPGEHVPLSPGNHNFYIKADIELFAGSTTSLGRKTVGNSGDSPLSFTKHKASYTLTFLVINL